MKAENIIRDLNISGLLKTPLPDRIQQVRQALQKIQEITIALSEQKDDGTITAVKAGTVLTFAVIRKILGGKRPEEFSADDWKEMTDTVLDYAVLMDDQMYTQYVFLMYAGYLDASAEAISKKVSPKVSGSIHALAEELREYSEQRAEGEISEPDYVDQCLWISFEGIIKILSALFGTVAGKELSEFTAALGYLAVQYARLQIYNQENAVLDEILEHQRELDERLQKEYEAYVQSVTAKAEQFQLLIENAFSPDFRDMLHGSVQLARAAGVDEEEILKSETEIDDFFTLLYFTLLYFTLLYRKVRLLEVYEFITISIG